LKIGWLYYSALLLLQQIAFPDCVCTATFRLAD
jgi:hypothetical protein